MRLPERGEGQLRIGVAITVPEPFATELQVARQGFKDPLALTIPPHITLLGPTVVNEADMDEVHEHLAGVAATVPTFLVHLRSSGTFRPISQVVFVQVAQGIAECEMLETAIRRGPLAQELRFHYHPHVTVAHDVPATQLNVAFEDMASYEASFAANEIQLYEHGDDNKWRVVRSYPLISEVTDDDFPTVLVPPPDA
ncbi:2'-5' RNA ligase family protein [Rarobacter faecitabidus]|uniref:2'-5' RNA ligase n=1 Tax=Rarobacter faecitabidus TaxID=13243 RepID=A0A542ZUN4_RARFA|nr:2'-5' RNA ligase family protein [Rarobacter faecitabidus]TQL64052.1 2'-5' RNA ligase [Rarobacter faecitabidus]